MHKVSNNRLTDEQIKRMDENESWFKIVVKVIRWKDGSNQNNNFSVAEKISQEEWKRYCKTKLEKNLSFDKKKITQELEDTRQKINAMHGFK